MKSGAFLAAVLLSAHSLSAAVYNYTVGPEQVGVGQLLNAPDVAGNVPFGDGIGAPGWGDSSFISELDGTTEHYTNLYVDLQLAFQTATPLTIADLAGITYFTKKGDAAVGLDWAIRIYTQPTPAVNDWFEYRLEGQNPNANNTEWNLADANSDGWFVKSVQGMIGVNPRVETNISLSLGGLDADYGEKEIRYFALFVGSSTNTEVIRNNLDGIVFTLANGDEARINLVPEPSAALLLLAGAGIFWVVRRCRPTAAA